MFTVVWKNPWFRLSILLLVGVMGGYALLSIKEVLVPFIISFILAYIFDPAVDIFEKRRIPRAGGIAIIVLILLVVVTGFLLIIVPMLVDQIQQLVSSLPAYFDWIVANGLPWVEQQFKIQLPKSTTEVLTQLKGHLTYFKDFNWKSLSPAGEILKSAFSGAAGFLVFVINLLVIPVVTFYLLIDFDRIKAHVFSYIPQKRQKITLKYAREVDEVLSNFIRGQVTVAVIMAGLYTLGLWIAGIPLWALIGIVAGAVSFIPYLGLMIGIVPSMILAFMEYRDVKHLIYVAVVFAVVQGLEGTVITPRIVGNKLGLHPVTIMFAVLLGGHTYGVAGILLAIPVFAVLSVFFRAFRHYYFQSSWYLRSEEHTSELQSH